MRNVQTNRCGGRSRVMGLCLFALGALVACGEDRSPAPVIDAETPDAPNGDTDAGPDAPGQVPVAKHPGGDAGEPTVDEPPKTPSADQGLPPRDRPPRIDTRILVRFVSATYEPVAHALVHARGRPVETDIGGFAEIDDVYGEDGFADVFSVTGTELVGAHVRVPLADGVSPHAALLVQPPIVDTPGAEPLVDLSAPPDVERLDATSGEVVFAFKSAAPLRTGWDALPTGAGTLRFQVATRPVGLWAPGGLALSTDAGDVPLDATAAFQVGASQGGSFMELSQPADVTVRVLMHAQNARSFGSVLDAGMGDASEPLSLYRFDRKRGRFVLAGSATYQPVQTGWATASARIERMGFYVIGRAAALDGCQRVAFNDPSGAPVANAALRVADSGIGLSVWLDADGVGCVPGPADRVLYGALFGLQGGVLVFGEADLFPMKAPMACGADCAHARVVAGSAIRMGCITASFVGTPGLNVSLTDATGEAITLGRLPQDESMCLQLPVGATIALSDGDGYTCPAAITVADTAARCGSEACQDLGQLQCCAAQERCQNRHDDDCDGQVDEGCTCDVECLDYGLPPCCTDIGTCGIVPLDDDAACLEAHTDDFNFDPSCPTESLVVDDANMTYSGCCLPDGRCGIIAGGFGCLAREQAHRYLPLMTSLVPAACMP